MIRKSLLVLLGFYQKFVSVISHGSCRYYPTCSEYAKWRIQKDNLLIALVMSLWRILRCNQLFAGGIEYPMVRTRFTNVQYKKIDVEFWFVPKDTKSFYLIKSLKASDV